MQPLKHPPKQKLKQPTSRKLEQTIQPQIDCYTTTNKNNFIDTGNKVKGKKNNQEEFQINLSKPLNTKSNENSFNTTNPCISCLAFMSIKEKLQILNYWFGKAFGL